MTKIFTDLKIGKNKEVVMLEDLRFDLNERYWEEYESSVEECERILQNTANSKDKWAQYFHILALKFIHATQLTEDWKSSFYSEHTLIELQKLNKALFKGVEPEAYPDSVFNPAWAAKEFGLDLGKIAAGIAAMFQPLYHFAVDGQFFSLAHKGSMLSEIYHAPREAEAWIKIIRKSMMRPDSDIARYRSMKQYSVRYRQNLDIVEQADLHDLRYLYQYLNSVGTNEVETARFLNAYPEEKITKLAETLVKAYIQGFETDSKDYKIKSTVIVNYNMGQEQIIRKALPMLREYGLEPLIPQVGFSKVNPQFSYDHRWDSALYLTEELVDKSVAEQEESSNRLSELIKGYSGAIYFERFGEKLFSPEQKEECLKLDKKQQMLMKKFNLHSRQIFDKYAPRSETSFCIIGFPLPEIGDKFPEIFENTAEINMLDSELWTNIQQKIIDLLDKADYVEVRGKGDNQTDMRVQMQKLDDPDKQTNFVNCGADVNIPVGEVFTSPQLSGTDGVLHITDIYIDDLRYDNLRITFKNGFASEYTCTNYENEEKNIKYVYESLFLPHEKLPLGEFAIGTNTPAYLMAKRFHILSQMPVLIIEKMGPHFAIGDTCFSWEEDKPVFNPDGKEITARDNEVSIFRKTDMNKAYTNKHTDITLPYEELAYITAVSQSGQRFDIIRDGRFVVPGTEVLNKPLEELEKL
jgi:aminopeptidase